MLFPITHKTHCQSSSSSSYSRHGKKEVSVYSNVIRYSFQSRTMSSSISRCYQRSIRQARDISPHSLGCPCWVFWILLVYKMEKRISMVQDTNVSEMSHYCNPAVRLTPARMVDTSIASTVRCRNLLHMTSRRSETAIGTTRDDVLKSGVGGRWQQKVEEERFQ